MSNASPSISEKFSTTASNFFSSLNANAGNNGLSSLFQNLLATVQNIESDATAKAKATATASTSASSDTNTVSSIATVTPINTLKISSALTQALHNFSISWAKYQHSNVDNHASQSQTQNKNTASDKSTTSSPTAQATASTTTNGTNSSATSTNTTSTDDSTNNTPTLGDLVAQLQTIAQLLQKQLQPSATDTTNGAPATTDATAAIDPTSVDPSTQPATLNDLLALAQLIQKKLDPTSNAAGAEGNSPTAGLDQQLKADFKNLLDVLKTAIAPSAKDTAAADATTTAPSPTAQATPADTSILKNPNAPLNPDVTLPLTKESAGDMTASTADFMKQLNSSLGNNPNSGSNTAATLTVNAIASTEGKDENAFTSNSNNGGANTNSGLSAQQPTPTAAAESAKSANPYSFASQLSATRAQNGGTVGLPTPVEQVILQLSRNVKSGNDQLSIQLHPADLGTINVKLNVNANGTVSGTVVANNADTLSMLQKDSRSLERALQEAGLRAESGSLEFSLGGQSNSNNFAETQQKSNGNTSNGTNGNGPATVTADADLDTTDSWVITPGRINIKV